MYDKIHYKLKKNKNKKKINKLLKVLVVQLCPTLCNSMVCGTSGPLSVGFSRQAYWSGVPFPSPEDLPDPGIEPGSPALQADSLLSKPPGKPTKI